MSNTLSCSTVVVEEVALPCEKFDRLEIKSSLDPVWRTHEDRSRIHSKYLRKPCTILITLHQVSNLTVGTETLPIGPIGNRTRMTNKWILSSEMWKRRGGLRISHVHKIGCCCFCCLSSYYCCCMLAARVPSKSNKRSHTKELCMWPAIPPSHFFFAFAARYEASKPSSSSKLQLRTNAKEHQASLYITATITAPSRALQKQPK